MKSSTPRHVCLLGFADFSRRLGAVLRRPHEEPTLQNLNIVTSTPGDARAVVFTERPDILVVEVGHATKWRDATWLKAFLEQIRERFGTKVYIILAVTSPERLVQASLMFFADETSLEPSLLIDSMIMSPPSGVPSIASIEVQLLDAIEYALGELHRRDSGAPELPALWAPNWVPVMCDPESRNVWMRWLPRYALYTNENPLIVGPTGSGKTRLAAAIHELSGRSGPFISITPRDFSSSELVQAELFGAVAGAYTGAVDKWGLVKKADKGTLFIDELQSIDRDLQGKLITFIENKSYRRVGEAESHHADVRFVFATNRSLHDLVSDGSLRDDFAYRLERLQISLPALSGRRLDISAGLCFALGKVLREREAAKRSNPNASPTDASAKVGSALLEGMTEDAYRTLFSSSWPGNLRQLENTVAKLIELASIRNLRLIDRDCTGVTLQGMLGKTEVSAAQVFERAAIDVALRATTDGYESLTECVHGLMENARGRALELSGGDIKKASELILDSEEALSLFALIRETEDFA